jgi:hypothetical protein
MSLRVESAPREPWPPAATQPVTASSPTDVATVLLECMINSRGAQQESARAEAEHAHRLVERAREQIQRAMERAEQAKEEGDFWGDVSRVLGSDVAAIAGVLGAVALAVATGGAGLPAVLAVGAALCTGIAKIGEELGLDPRLTLAFSAIGGALGAFAGSVTGASTAWTTLAQVAGAAQSAAAAGGGGATIAEGQYRAEATDHQAEATAARGRQQDAWLRLDLALALLDRACRDVSRAKERTTDIVQNEDAGQSAVISRMGAV